MAPSEPPEQLTGLTTAVGKMVGQVIKTRPMSKLKTWKVIERVTASKGAAVEADV